MCQDLNTTILKLLLSLTLGTNAVLYFGNNPLLPTLYIIFKHFIIIHIKKLCLQPDCKPVHLNEDIAYKSGIIK